MVILRTYTGRSLLSVALMWFSLSGYLQAQPPIVQSISRTSGTINDKITIIGSNFSSNPSDLILYFGGVRGTIVSSTGGSISATIPGNATTDNVTVLNKTNGLQGSSGQVFFNSFSGLGFDPSLVSSELNLAETSELFDLTLCDFNNDNKLDVAVTKVSSATDIDVYKNNSTPGSLNFQKLSKFTNPELDLLSTTSNITCADLDGDGLKDIIVTKSGNPRNVVFVLRNISTPSTIKFDNYKSYFIPTEDIALNVQARDLDRDGKPEMIVTNTFDNHVAVFRNQSTVGAISFAATPTVLTFTGANTTGGLSVEDLNGDSYPDIAVNPYIEANLYVMVNQSTPGNISFNASQSISISGNLNNIAWGDYNGDGKTDLAVSKTIQNQVAVLLNLSNTGDNTITFDTPINVSTDAGPWGISAADMDGNGKPDILVGLRDTRSVDLLLNSNTAGQASFTKTQINTAYFTRNIRAGDMDGDAKPDFVYTSFDAGASKYNLSIIRNLNCFVPKVTPAGSQVICSGDTINLVSNQGYNIEYRWDKDNVVVKDNSENFYDVTQAGTYKVIAINADSSCQKVSNAVIINSGSGTAPPQPVITNNGPFCIGEDIVLTTNAVSGATYSWSGPNGFTATTQNITISGAATDDAGIYTLVESAGGCNSDPGSTVVEVDELPDFVVSTGDPTTFCIGNSVNLQVTSLSGYNYQWLKNNTAVSGATGISYNANENGSFSVEVTSQSSSCQTTSNAITLTSIVQPNAVYSIDGNACVGVNLILTNNSTYESSQPVSFDWSYGDGSPGDNSKNSSHTYTTAGNYPLRMIVKYQNGACADTVIQTVAVHDSPVCTISEDPTTILCEGETKTLTVDQTFAGYLWNIDSTGQAVTVTTSGDYSVVVTDQNACQDTCNINVSFNPKPNVTASADPQQADPGSKITLTASGALQYIWNHAELLDDSTSSSPIATVFDSTLFIVIGINADGCSDTDSVLVTIPPGSGINVTPAKLFSPNGDGIDDFWVIGNIESYPDCTVTIYNGNGRIVYQATPYNNLWNAVYQGHDLPEGVYFFIIKGKDRGEPKTGSVTVIR